MKKKHRSLWLRFDRILSHDLLKQAFVLVCLLCVLFLLSFLLLSASNSQWLEICREKEMPKWMLPLYLLLDTNLYSTLYMDDHVRGWMLFASSISYLAGVVVFNGMIISLMTNAIGRRIERHNDGLIHYLQSGHYIIMGYDDICPSIVDAIFAKDPDAYILILTSLTPSEIQEQLRRSLGDEPLKRIIVNYGDRISQDEYGDIHLESAEEIYIAGDRTLPAHDAINVECVDTICAYLNQVKPAEMPRRITCVFEDLDTYAAFKTSEIFGAVRELGIEFVPYNFYAGWAKQIFVRRYHHNRLFPEKSLRYPAVYGGGIRPEDDKFVHLVFVGTTNFAVAFAMEAAQALHFPNYARCNSLRTRITFIDLNADTERHIFITRNRRFFDVQQPLYRNLSGDGEAGAGGEEYTRKYDTTDFLDVEFEFIKGDVFSETIRAELAGWAGDEGQYLSVFLAMANQRDNFTIGMNMPDEIYDRQIPLFIRQDRSDNLVVNLRDADRQTTWPYTVFDAQSRTLHTEERHGRYANVYPFGMSDTGYFADETALQRAKLINFLYTTADYSTDTFTPMPELDAMPAEDIWEVAESAWRKRNVAEQWSSLYNAYSIPCKVASLRAMRGLAADDDSCDLQPMSPDEVSVMGIVEHNRWNVEKLLMGYRKPYPHEDKYLHDEAAAELARNKKLFIHHDIRPYEELDKVINFDREFISYIPWLLRMTQSPNTKQ